MYAQNRNYLQRTLAFSLAGLVFFVLMISYPFLGISIKGVVREVSLLESIVTLYKGDSWMLSILVGVVLILFPLLKVLGLIALLLPLQMNRRLPGWHICCKMVEWLWPWNMTEIYLVGVIVTFVKLSSMASIIYGTAFWVFIAFVFTMTAAKTSLNFTSLWNRLDPL